MQNSRTEKTAGIGVLLFANSGDRIVGDPGAPGTFPFPVRYGVVPGSYRDLIQGSPEVCRRLCQAAQELEEQGVSAIAGDCGLLVLYQNQLTRSVRVPVVSSSLVLLPLAQRLVGEEQKIGLITGHSQLLSQLHLERAGADLNRLVIQGMEEEPHFRQVVLEGGVPQDYSLMARDVLQATRKLLERAGQLGAVVLECSNLTTFAWEITSQFGVPVLDVNLAIQLLHAAQTHVNYSPNQDDSN